MISATAFWELSIDPIRRSKYDMAYSLSLNMRSILFSMFRILS